MPIDCYFDDDGCYVCPAEPAQPAIPYSRTVDPLLGWNAGADSVTTLAGDVHVTWSVDDLPAGIALGLKSTRLLPAELALLDHGLFVFPVAGEAFVQVIENGRQIGTPQAYVLTTTLEVRRVGSVMTYWNNGVLLASTKAHTAGALIVNACLYSAGDSVP